MSELALHCKYCKSTDYYIQDGLYFCEECNIQHDGMLEMEYDEQENDNTQPQHRIRLRADRKKQKDDMKARRLTSWEEYNHILIGLVDEILTLKSIPKFKITCLQLWMTYLKRAEAAFFNKTENTAPKLFAFYRQNDAEILYNKKPKEKRQRQKKAKTSGADDDGNDDQESQRRRTKQMRKSEKAISEQLSESLKSDSLSGSMLANLSIDTIISDHENAEMYIEFSEVANRIRKHKLKGDGGGTSHNESKILFQQMKPSERPNHLRGATLLYIIYCALNICGSDIQLSDLTRLVREGYLSYFRCKQMLPEDLIEHDVLLSFEQFNNYRIVSYDNIRLQLTYFVRMMPELGTSLVMPKLDELCYRYLDELNLPFDLRPPIERLLNLLPPEMSFKTNKMLPNYEGRAMAYILFVLKLLFGLDGYREKEMSEAATKVNRTLKKCGLKKRLFVYEDWRRYIEYREVILEKFYYPTIFKSNYKGSKPYAAFNVTMESLDPKTGRNESQTVAMRNEKRMRSKMNAEEILTNLIKNHSEHDGEAVDPMKQFTFKVSFTPLKDAFQHILLNEVRLNPDEYDVKLVAFDFASDSCEWFLDPRQLVDELKISNVDLITRKATFPKCFVLVKPEARFAHSKEVYAAETEEISEDHWRDALKNRTRWEKNAKEKSKLEFHESRMRFVLNKRKQWQKLISNKKSQNININRGESEDGPRTYRESSLLSDMSDEDEELITDDIELEPSDDPELEEIFKQHAESYSENSNAKLTFVTPDYNMWQTLFHFDEKGLKIFEYKLESLPRTFLWLLKVCSNILHQHPLTLYLQLMCIEHQFMNVYKPAELIENVLLKQGTKVNRNAFVGVALKKFEALW